MRRHTVCAVPDLAPAAADRTAAAGGPTDRTRRRRRSITTARAGVRAGEAARLRGAGRPRDRTTGYCPGPRDRTYCPGPRDRTSHGGVPGRATAPPTAVSRAARTPRTPSRPRGPRTAKGGRTVMVRPPTSCQCWALRRLRAAHMMPPPARITAAAAPAMIGVALEPPVSARPPPGVVLGGAEGVAGALVAGALVAGALVLGVSLGEGEVSLGVGEGASSTASGSGTRPRRPARSWTRRARTGRRHRPRRPDGR